MKIPVVTIKDEELTMLDIEDILYISTDKNKKKIVIHTFDCEYNPVVNLQDFYRLLNSHGFENIDKSNVVNTKKITRINYNSRIIYFDKKGKLTKACIVSRRQIDKIKQIRSN